MRRQRVAHIGVEPAEKGVIVGLKEVGFDHLSVFGGVALVELLQSWAHRAETTEVALVHGFYGGLNVRLESVVDFLDFLSHFAKVERRVARVAVQYFSRSVGAIVHLVGVVEGVAREISDSFVLAALSVGVDASVDRAEVEGFAYVGRSEDKVDEGESRLEGVLLLRKILVRSHFIGEKRIVVVEN